MNFCGAPILRANNGTDRGTCTRLSPHQGYKHRNGTCSGCGVKLASENTTPTVEKKGSGFCRECSTKRNRQRRGCKELKRQYPETTYTFPCGCSGILPRRGESNKFARSTSRAFVCRVSGLLARSKDAGLTYQYKPIPSDTPHSVIRRMMDKSACVICGQLLDWENLGREKRAPHLHHNHTTGEPIGFAHDHCNPSAEKQESLQLYQENTRLKQILREGVYGVMSNEFAKETRDRVSEQNSSPVASQDCGTPIIPVSSQVEDGQHFSDTDPNSTDNDNSHIRKRLYFVADSNRTDGTTRGNQGIVEREVSDEKERGEAKLRPTDNLADGIVGGLANAQLQPLQSSVRGSSRNRSGTTGSTGRHSDGESRSTGAVDIVGDTEGGRLLRIGDDKETTGRLGTTHPSESDDDLGNSTSVRQCGGGKNGDTPTSGLTEPLRDTQPPEVFGAGCTQGFWKRAVWLYGKDGYYRPTGETKPSVEQMAAGLADQLGYHSDGDTSFISPLVSETPNRVGRLRGYGNALCAPVAQSFIEAYLAAKI